MLILNILGIILFLIGILIYVFRLSNILMFIIGLEIMSMGLGLLFLSIGLNLDDLNSTILFISLLVISGVDLVCILSYMLVYGRIKGNINISSNLNI